MMKANELRIGNYVLAKEVFSFKKINYFEIKKVNLKDIDDCRMAPKCFKPIELTEELLLKCGFEKQQGTLRDCRLLIQKGEGGGNPN